MAPQRRDLSRPVVGATFVGTASRSDVLGLIQAIKVLIGTHTSGAA